MSIRRSVSAVLATAVLTWACGDSTDPRKQTGEESVPKPQPSETDSQIPSTTSTEVPATDSANCPRRRSTGVIDSNDTGYLYAPSFMRTSDGVLHYWACWSGEGKGDNIGWKAAARLEDLDDIPVIAVLKPSKKFPFDHLHTCDPSVVRSPSDGKYYMHYGGETNPTVKGVGVAVSDNPNGPFEKLGFYVSTPPDAYVGGTACTSNADCPSYTGCDINNTKQCIAVYGVGQPSVTIGPDGWYYVIYTSQIEPVSRDALVVLRSKDPSFLSSREEVRRIAPFGWSVHLSYDPQAKQFLVSVPDRHFIVVHYDLDFNQLGTTVYPAKTTPQAGVALLSDDQQHPTDISGNWVFASSTEGSGGEPTVRGPNWYEMFERGSAPLGSCSTPPPPCDTECPKRCQQAKRACLDTCEAGDLDCQATCNEDYTFCKKNCPTC